MFRHLQKRVRAAELMKSSSLPPSMARRERVKSACTRLEDAKKSCDENLGSRNSVRSSNVTSPPLERCRSAMSLLPQRGNNLAAILRCQVSRCLSERCLSVCYTGNRSHHAISHFCLCFREKLEREIKDKMEEKRREQEIRMRESWIGRNPVWRALRSAARYDSLQVRSPYAYHFSAR